MIKWLGDVKCSIVLGLRSCTHSVYPPRSMSSNRNNVISLVVLNVSPCKEKAAINPISKAALGRR